MSFSKLHEYFQLFILTMERMVIVETKTIELKTNPEKSHRL